MKLRDLLSENKFKLNEGWVQEEQPQGLTTEDKRAFLESVGSFNSYGKSIYREADFKSMTEEIGKMIEMAKSVALQEGDWFDGITVNRHMKGLGESYKIFEKTAKEMHVLQQRMEACYEDIGGTLGKYFDIKELAEKLDPVGKEDDDVDNDGDVDDSDSYLSNRRDVISKAIDNEEDVDEVTKASLGYSADDYDSKGNRKKRK